MFHLLKLGVNRRILVATFIIILISLTAFLYFYFQVKHIVVISESPTLYGLEKYENKNIFWVDPSEESKYLLLENPSFKNVIMNKKLPQSIYIETKLRKAVAEVSIGERKILLDEDGVLVSSSSATINQQLLPITMGRNPIISGYQADATVVKAIAYGKEFEKNNFEVKSIEISDDHGAYTILLLPDIKIIVPYTENQEIISSSLQLILTRFRIEGKRVTSVNFLFDKPIITLANE